MEKALAMLPSVMLVIFSVPVSVWTERTFKKYRDKIHNADSLDCINQFVIYHMIWDLKYYQIANTFLK